MCLTLLYGNGRRRHINTSAHISPHTAASTICFENVLKRFPHAERTAVDSVTLAVEPGQFVVLLGPSGCAIPAPTLRRCIGYVIQQTGLFPHMRVGDNIAVVPKPLGWDKAKIRCIVHRRWHHSCIHLINEHRST